jgi:RNA polymerase sigma factor (sigma-70 family)
VPKPAPEPDKSRRAAKGKAPKPVDATPPKPTSKTGETIGIFKKLRDNRHDDDAWRRFDAKLRDCLMSTLRGKKIPRFAEAEDVVQNALLRAFESFPTWEAVAPRAWIRAVLENTLKDYQRRELAGKRGGGKVGELDADLEHAVQVRDRRAEPPSEKERLAELKSIVRRITDRLDPKYAEVLRLREVEEREFDEIAAILKLSEVGVRARLMRARNKRLELLRPYVPPEMLRAFLNDKEKDEA